MKEALVFHLTGIRPTLKFDKFLDLMSVRIFPSDKLRYGMSQLTVIAFRVLVMLTSCPE
jgi:hypothetical protein